jgi:hypothetical protein
MGKPRLPWKRGPIAWEVANRADEILEALAENRRRFLSLRRASEMLGVSTQPLRDWIKLGYLKQDGPVRNDEFLECADVSAHSKFSPPQLPRMTQPP